MKSAEAALELARLQLSYTKIAAPADGMASKLAVHAGQLRRRRPADRRAGPVGDLRGRELQGDAGGPDAARPDRARSRIDAYPHREFDGKVESLSGGTGASFSLLPAGQRVGQLRQGRAARAGAHRLGQPAVRRDAARGALGRRDRSGGQVRLRSVLPLLVVLLPASASADARRLSIEDVVRIALSSHPRLAATRSRAEGAHDLASSARSRMLPTIAISEEYQHYDSPFEVAFAIPSPVPVPPVLAREQNTNTFVVGASQPLVGLLRRGEDSKAQARTAEAADAGVRVAEAATREALEVQYLRMFEAKAMEDIAHASEGELGEQVTVTAARVKAGALNQADLLRVQVAQANARQQGITARTQVTVARATLLGAIGLPPSDRTVEFAEPTALLHAEPAPAVSAEAAQTRRPEIAQASLTAEAADHQARARGYALLPEVSLEGAYVRVDGQVFAPKNSGFVGVKAEWPIWEWGATESVHRVFGTGRRRALRPRDPAPTGCRGSDVA